MAACRALFTILDSEREDEGKRVIDRATGDLEFLQCDVYLPGP